MQAVSNLGSDIPGGTTSLKGGVQRFRMRNGEEYGRGVLPFAYYDLVRNDKRAKNGIVQEALEHFRKLAPKEKAKMLSIYDISKKNNGCTTINPNYEKVLPFLEVIDYHHNPDKPEKIRMYQKYAQADEAFLRGFFKRAEESKQMSPAEYKRIMHLPAGHPDIAPVFRPSTNSVKSLPPKPKGFNVGKKDVFNQIFKKQSFEKQSVSTGGKPLPTLGNMGDGSLPTLGNMGGKPLPTLGNMGGRPLPTNASMAGNIGSSLSGLRAPMQRTPQNQVAAAPVNSGMQRRIAMPSIPYAKHRTSWVSSHSTSFPISPNSIPNSRPRTSWNICDETSHAVKFWTK
jgi:hypothetical protein